MTTNSSRLEWALTLVSGTVLLVIAALYINARMGLYRHYDVPLQPLEVTPAPEMAVEGERLAVLRGCFWCHGPKLDGKRYFADASAGVIVTAPNLTKKVREYAPDEFARAVRQGIRPDGTSVQPAMPSFAFYNMSDSDMAAIIAYIQSIPEQPGVDGQFKLQPLGWYRWSLGKLPPNAVELIDHEAPKPDPAVNGAPVARGEYLARSVCTECHGDNGRLRVPTTPNLEVALTYSRDEFFTLMRTGAPRVERKIDHHMVDVAKYRYIRFTDAEIDALYTYLQSLGD